MPAFDENPFRMLRIAPAIRLEDALEAKDDAVFDGRIDVRAADEAMRRLSDPRLRLDVELGWPLDAGDLGDPGLPERLSNQSIETAMSDAPLARMLLLSYYISAHHLKADVSGVNELAELWQAIRPETITQLVNDARKKAGVPVTAQDQVANALTQRGNRCVRDLLISLGAPDTAGPVLSEAVQRRDASTTFAALKSARMLRSKSCT